MRTWFLLLLLSCGAIAACSGRRSETGDNTPDASAVVVRGADLSAGNLLESLRMRIPTMTVSMRTDECPRIAFRGTRSFRSPGKPGVYVDGTHMLDTCILTQISTHDIDFVEVYPNGNTSRPGIQRNGNGLILVFRRRA